VIQQQSRPIYWFPLVGMNLQGFIFLFSILALVLLEAFSLLTPGGFICY
jgi:hypothetical protein